MTSSRALVSTDRPSRYGKQLVNHLGRKMGGEWDEAASTGWVTLPDSRLEVTTADGVLDLVLTSTEASIEQYEGVVGRHLVRFGSRDELVCAWTRADGSAGTRQEHLED